MTTPLKGKKYKTTFVLTAEERFDSDEMAIYEAEETLNSLGNGLESSLIRDSCKRKFILRIDRYNGNKPATRIFPDPKHDGLLAIEEVTSYILDIEDSDKLTDDAPDNVFTQAVKITNNFLRKI